MFLQSTVANSGVHMVIDSSLCSKLHTEGPSTDHSVIVRISRFNISKSINVPPSFPTVQSWSPPGKKKILPNFRPASHGSRQDAGNCQATDTPPLTFKYGPSQTHCTTVQTSLFLNSGEKTITLTTAHRQSTRLY